MADTSARHLFVIKTARKQLRISCWRGVSRCHDRSVEARVSTGPAPNGVSSMIQMRADIILEFAFFSIDARRRAAEIYLHG